jgi:hypothetical protein
MKIDCIHDTTDVRTVDLLKRGLSTVTDSDIIKNYHPDYSQTPGNLFYILEQGRYSHGRGKYFIITDDDKYIASAGWNQYDLDGDVALLLTRMYVNPEYRAQYIIGKTVLPQMIEETVNYSKRWITANEYNRAIYIYFQRASEHRRPTLFNDWPEIYRRFRPIGKRMIYYTEQYVAEYTND